MAPLVCSRCSPGAFSGRHQNMTLMLLLIGIVHQLTNMCIRIQPVTAWSSTSLVTGANGYVGRAVVHELLSRSQQSEQHLIICLIRPQRVVSEIEYWKSVVQHDDNMSGCSTTIRVLPYDMLDGGATLKAALEVASSTSDNNNDHSPCCVFHIASVFGPTDDHQQTALDNVRGTEDLIATLLADRQATGKPPFKLILTSSMAAVRATGQEPLNGQYYTWKDWNTLSELGANWGASYQWSKAKSERRAWDLCRAHDIPMVSLCPSFVFGPPAGNNGSSSYSLTLVGQWVHGESPVQSRLFVDLRDVARAHVEAARREAAIGQRYIVSAEARVPSGTIAEWIREEIMSTPDVTTADPEKIHFDADFAGGSIAIGEQEVEAAERLEKELGVTLRNVKSTITEMAQILLQLESKQQQT